MTAYSIGGINYMRPRDIGRAQYLAAYRRILDEMCRSMTGAALTESIS